MPQRPIVFLGFCLVVVALLAPACTGGSDCGLVDCSVSTTDDDNDSSSSTDDDVELEEVAQQLPDEVTETIQAAAGGALRVQGCVVTIQANALTEDAEITVRLAASAAAPRRSPLFAFLPHGLTFAQPVTVAIEYDASADGAPAVYWTKPDLTAPDPDEAASFEAVAADQVQFNASTAQFTVNHFSYGYVGGVVEPADADEEADVEADAEADVEAESEAEADAPEDASEDEAELDGAEDAPEAAEDAA